MAQQPNQANARVKTPLDDFKLRIQALEAIGTSQKKPSLGVTLRGRDLTFEATTNADGDSDDYGKIKLALDLYEGYGLLDTILKYCDPAYPAGSEAVLINTTFKYGKYQNPPVLDGKIAVGKETTGAIYIQIISAKDTRPKPKFHFAERWLYKRVKANGEKYTMGEISAMNAKAFVDVIRALIPNAVPQQFAIAQAKDDAKYAEKQARENGGGNNYSGGNRGGSNNYAAGGAAGGGGYDDVAGVDDLPPGF